MAILAVPPTDTFTVLFTIYVNAPAVEAMRLASGYLRDTQYETGALEIVP